MLKFNIPKYLPYRIKLSYLNTSYVKVQPFPSFLNPKANTNLNTSYVKVQHKVI